MAPSTTPAKPKTEVRTVIQFIVRVLQIVFCIACLGAAAHWSKTWSPFRTGTFQVYAMLQSVSLAIFASVTGALLAAFMLFAPRVAPSVADDLPGLIDLVINGIWSMFFLAAGASLLSWGTCKAASLCMAWNATIGLCFFLWVLFTAAAVIAGLDLRAQVKALTGTPPGPQPGTPTGKSTPRTTPGTPTAASKADKAAVKAADVTAVATGGENAV